MSYQIVDYRPVQCGTFWTVDVRVKTTEKFLFFFTSTKYRWMSCGRDGQPRLFYKFPFNMIPNNRLLIVDTKDQVDQKIKDFKIKQNWNHLKK